MATLTYSVITSLDGYVADTAGNFDWAAPDEQVHAFVNDLESGVGTYLYGRRMYEVMSVWDRAETVPGPSPIVQQYARIWRAADKVVYSSTLEAVRTGRTRLERTFDPLEVAALVRAAPGEVSVGGPGLAAQAIAAGLVDDYHLFVNPVLVGGGTAALPDAVRIGLELVDLDRFDNGVVHLHYRSRH